MPRFLQWALFALFQLHAVVIDCSRSSTRRPLSLMADPQSSLENRTSDNNNTLRAGRFGDDALKDIAYYLRGHKFNEYDRRYETKSEGARRGYHKSFPRPPLRSLHWEVHKHCEPSFLECVHYLKQKIKGTGLKRVDDTAVVIQEQKWTRRNNSEQIKTVDAECRKMLQSDDIRANPFEGPIERFQWRTTASYFMCWYTMKGEPALERFRDACDNLANCLDFKIGPRNWDPRADDFRPFSCALYSFCPDPCCPAKILEKIEDCWDSEENPCRAGNPRGQRQCSLNRSMNTEFRDLILNRWNVSCSCPQKGGGYVWNSLYGICVDVDECTSAAHNCDTKLEVCVNLPGNFKCVCKWGHGRDARTQKCTPSAALAHFLLMENRSDENVKSQSMFRKFFRIFSKSSGTSIKLEADAAAAFPFLLFIVKYLR